jgi:diacylglycerol kinase family enzyme
VATVLGGDVELARAVAEHPGGRLRLVPTGPSDLARAVGLGEASGAGLVEVPLDALRLADGSLAVNAVVIGSAPHRVRWGSRAPRTTIRLDGREVWRGRATTVVVAVGQFVDGHDLVPRGHPGDGRVELQVFALRRRERAAMRRRLPQGAHMPHPRIQQWSGRRFEVRVRTARRLEVDGARRGRIRELKVLVEPAAYRLVV